MKSQNHYTDDTNGKKRKYGFTICTFIFCTMFSLPSCAAEDFAVAATGTGQEKKSVPEVQKKQLGMQRKFGEKYDFNTHVLGAHDGSPFAFIRDAYVLLSKSPPLNDADSRVDRYVERLGGKFRERAKMLDSEAARVVAVALHDASKSSDITPEEKDKREAINRLFWKGRYDLVVDEIKAGGANIANRLRSVEDKVHPAVQRLREQIEKAEGKEMLRVYVDELRQWGKRRWSDLTKATQVALREVRSLLQKKLEAQREKSPLMKRAAEKSLEDLQEIPMSE